MINRELPPPPTRSIDEIRDPVDKYFFIFLQRIFPKGTIIAYEKVPIDWDRKDRKRKTTKPDFYVKTPNGHGLFIEVTTSKRRKGKRDPKKWQKRIVRNGAPEIKFYVYYRDNLKTIQKYHPDLEFFREDGSANTLKLWTKLPTYRSAFEF